MQPCNAANIKSNQFKNEFQIKNYMSIAIQNLILEISMKSKLSSTLKKVLISYLKKSKIKIKIKAKIKI